MAPTPVDGRAGILLPVARGASAVAVPIVAGMGLSFVVSVALARWLGAAEYGTYTFTMSWVVLLCTVSMFGLENTIVSHLPKYASTGAWGLLRGLLRWANGVTLLASLVLVAGGLLAVSLVVGRGLGVPPAIWILAGLLVPLLTMSRVQQAALRGLHHPAIAQVPEPVLIPAGMLGLILASVSSGFIAPTAEHALLAMLLAASVAVAVAAFLVYRAIPVPARAGPSEYLHGEWLKTSARMFMLACLTTINGRVGILVLGIIAAPQVVGPYSVALRGAGLISLALNVTVLAMAPTLAAAWATGDRARLWRIARQMRLLALVGGVPVAAVLILWGRSFLLVFGPGFEGAVTALTILAAGELVNIAAGPVATLLVMTGHERDAVVGLGLGTALNAGLCLILVPASGITGAAVAAAAGVAVWNVVLWGFVRRRLAAEPPIHGDSSGSFSGN